MAGEGSGAFLVDAAIYLGAATVAVPIFNRLKLGSILGYLAAGVVIGPSGFNLMQQEEGVFHVAEFGVVLFLFVIGLELSLKRLWALRKDIFGLGAAQMIFTGAVIAALFVMTQVMPWQAATIAGLSLAFSSTAFALQYMKDRGELSSPYGEKAFPILLFQDLAVIPVLAIIPFLAGGDAGGAADWRNALKAVGVIAALVVIGRYALNPMLRLVATSGSREAFAATALFVVAAVSLAVSWAGLSMALGAFLAGALLAESAYRHQIETDIEPFRGLLLGLFFISIGMRLELAVIANSWPLVIGGAVGLVAIKTVITTIMTRLFGRDVETSLKTGAVISQGGEFAFVVLTLGVSAALFNDQQATLMSAIVTLSMMMTPFMMMAARKVGDNKAVDDGDMPEPPSAKGHVVIAGFGRMGQIISQVIQSAGIDVVAIDKNPTHIRNAERFGFKIYYGDASRLDVLKTAGVNDARAVIFTMDDTSSVNRGVEALRADLQNAFILVVAHDRMHEIELRPIGVDFIVRETLESSLLLAREALLGMGHSDALVDDYVSQFRERDRQRLLAQMDEGPEARLDLIHARFERKPTD
jgi:monovalent cation:proton antiporter-2 (CPA2) family protein